MQAPDRPETKARSLRTGQVLVSRGDHPPRVDRQGHPLVVRREAATVRLLIEPERVSQEEAHPQDAGHLQVVGAPAPTTGIRGLREIRVDTET